MWRALAALVVVLLVAGIYVLATGGAAAPTAAPDDPPATSFGYALAAGSIALAVTLLASRPRMRFRR